MKPGAIRRVWLTVDWDFFQEERTVWDWQHKESPLYTELLWGNRVFHMGQDIRPITSPERHEPKASSFWGHFRAADVSATEIGVGDSHALALPFFWHLAKTQGVPDEIWNFDAHHDIGYDDVSKLKAWTKAGRAEAGSWLYVLMNQKKCKKLIYEHVYPAWKDHTNEGRPWALDKEFSERVHQTCVTDFHWKRLANFRIEGIFIAKSEAWSPSWNDKAFVRFVHDTRARLDWLDVTEYGRKPCVEPRAWDERAVMAFQKQIDDFRKKQRP